MQWTSKPDFNVISGVNVAKLTTIYLAFKANKPGVTFTCSLTKGAAVVPSNCKTNETKDAAEVTYTNLLDGNYYFSVLAEDGAGHDFTLDLAWTIDVKGPSGLRVDNPKNGSFLNTSQPVFEGVVSTDGIRTTETVSVEVTFTKTNTTTVVGVVDGTWRFSPSMEQGEQTVIVRARDEVGNYTTDSISLSLNIDTLVPNINSIVATIGTGALVRGASTKERDVTFTFGANEPVQGYQCSLDGATFVNCNETHPITGLYDNSHVLRVKATDRAGNPSGVAEFNWIVDNTAPQVVILSGPPARTNQDAVSFKIGLAPGELSGVTYTCVLDGETLASCPEELTVSGFGTEVEEEEHVLEVTAEDKAGNVDSTPAIHRWVKDIKPPPAPLITAPLGTLELNTETVTVSGTAEPNSRITLFVAGVEAGTTLSDGAGNWSGQATLPRVTADYAITAAATDEAGTTGGRSSATTIRVDLDLPDTSIARGPASRSKETAAQFELASTSPDTVAFECALDLGDFSRCAGTNSHEIMGLEEGRHELKVRAVDRAGNVDDSPSVYSWRVDLGGATYATGGGLNCASAGQGAGPWQWLAVLGALAWLGRRRGTRVRH